MIYASSPTLVSVSAEQSAQLLYDLLHKLGLEAEIDGLHGRRYNSSQASDLGRKRPFEVADDLKRHEIPCFVGTPAHAAGTAIPSTSAPAR
jgi:hypothetical protein